MTIRSVGDEMFIRIKRQTDKRTGMTKLKDAFRHFANAPNKIIRRQAIDILW